MSNTTFRTSQPAQSSKPATTQVEADTSSTATKTEGEVSVPYLDYKNTYQKPFTVDYFGLGNLWDDNDGGFRNELAIIEDYMYHLIGDGQIANSTDAVKEKIKSIEKQAGINKFDSTTNRIAKVTAFTKFLKDTEKL